MGTPHNSAEKGDIAKTVLMPGDPLRAKYIAETYLENPKCFNQVRGMYGYTGRYNGKEISVMAHGMGIPSVAIYTYELFNFYDVDNIIRIGSAGGLQDDVNLKDIVIAMSATTDSAYVKNFGISGSYAPTADFGLLEKAVAAARKRNVNFHVGNVNCTDIFYADSKENDSLRAMGVLCSEMESAGLYCNAAKAGKHALTILTISDHLYKTEELTAEERQTGFGQMMEIALDVASSL
ncbi:purine-nucleoside phosphorylase [Lachnospiraceae bacterium C1.1]|nr:purine-nucleoside phosphorylase [Lachnospiraceae bacterium C1.1]